MGRSLARELKLGRELPQNTRPLRLSSPDADADSDPDETLGLPQVITEEEREERRRIWWLAYTVDRHLALCYNRPLFLLDIECKGLLQPLDDTLWQAGEFTSDDSASTPHTISPFATHRERRRGPQFEVTGHGIFGYFLPLMTILGAIVDLYHAKNHPRFGSGFRSASEWEAHTASIETQLDTYAASLSAFETLHLGPEEERMDDDDRSVHSGHSLVHEAAIQTKTVVAYSTHVLHVLHILLTGKWDPISLLDDNDLWISTPSFIAATSHAVSAAEAISSILSLDPALSHMPFFFGVYLLQGSFLLLLIADKLLGEASPSVVRACEMVVRAHEACVVTLSTEYQRNFRKVMRSALGQVNGRETGDGEARERRREVLGLYRWTGDGTGLAL